MAIAWALDKVIEFFLKVIQCRSLLKARGWSFVWNNRSSNGLANLLAKKTPKEKLPFTFVDTFAVSRLPDLLDAVMADVNATALAVCNPLFGAFLCIIILFFQGIFTKK